MARLAVQTDPQQSHSHTILGMNLLRLGHETEGSTHLERAFDQDPFNFRTFIACASSDAALNALEPRTSRPASHLGGGDWPYLKPVTRRELGHFHRQRRLYPQMHRVEVYPEHFEGTAGLPDIGPFVGFAFVPGDRAQIRLRLTSAPDHWQIVAWIVWHEVAHVITLQMTNNRLPRWLSEGISVYEEPRGRPEWGHNQDLELIQASRKTGSCPSPT